MEGMEELIAEFVTDTKEALENVDTRLVELETEADGTAILHDLFRTMHTIKGTCGFLGLQRMASVAHQAETLMDRLRNGAAPTQAAIDAMLQVVDRLRILLDSIEEAGGTEPDGDDEALIGILRDALNEDTSSKAAGESSQGDALHDALRPSESEGDEHPSVPGAGEPSGATAVGGRADPQLPALEPQREGDPKPDTHEPAPPTDPSEQALPPIEAEPNPKARSEKVAASPQPASARCSTPSATAEAAAPAAANMPRGGGSNGAEPSERAAESSIRVSVETLEHLMTVVSELVLTRNELSEILRDQEGTSHKLAMQRLSTVTGELQQAVMSTRMQPIGNAWRKLPRIVRDVAANLGKAIELELVGASTELDRQVLDSIKDPLVHMVRNAADHGLETPAERLAAGKPATGTIKLNAYHEGGQILVEIADDGRGLDVERIKRKAIERGITTQEDAERLTSEQIFSFIFEPGFSTAAAVTSVSGRGVGMDVVQSNIERIGGYIDVRSTKGVGSVFTLKIPLTLAILRALIVGAGSDEFAIAQTSVDELLKVEPGGAHTIKLIKDAPVLRSRDRLLPVVDLRAVLQLPLALDASGQPVRADENTKGFVMVIRARGTQFAMLVDTVLRTEEIVVKPLPTTLRGVDIFSGATILGDGRVIMIVDPNGVRSAASHPAEGTIQSVAKHLAEAEPLEQEDKELLLVFRADTKNRKALPISLITRLEEVALADAEQSNDQWHMNYHDELIPLVWFGEGPRAYDRPKMPLLVLSDEGHSMGLLVDEILDIVEDVVDVQIPSDRDGILGNAIIAGKATEIIDVSHFVRRASANWFEPQRLAMRRAEPIMLIDDSAFFRNLIAPVVRSAGYDPVVFGCAREAIAALEAGLSPRVIVTDVDMPGMDGFQFAQYVRSTDRLAQVPIVALTGLVNADAIAKARALGFADYIGKLDRAGLIATLQEFVGPTNRELAA